MFSNRVLNYLHKKAKEFGETKVEDLIWTYNSVNWPGYNEETRCPVLKGECAVVVGTSTIAVGVDISAFWMVVIFRDPQDLDELLQMVGWICVLHDNGTVVPG
jgi:Lhr-like helicase